MDSLLHGHNLHHLAKWQRVGAVAWGDVRVWIGLKVEGSDSNGGGGPSQGSDESSIPGAGSTGIG